MGDKKENGREDKKGPEEAGCVGKAGGAGVCCEERCGSDKRGGEHLSRTRQASSRPPSPVFSLERQRRRTRRGVNHCGSPLPRLHTLTSRTGSLFLPQLTHFAHKNMPRNPLLRGRRDHGICSRLVCSFADMLQMRRETEEMGEFERQGGEKKNAHSSVFKAVLMRPGGEGREEKGRRRSEDGAWR